MSPFVPGPIKIMKHLLNIERIDKAVEEFTATIEDTTCSIKIAQKRPYLKKQFIFERNTQKGYVNCHISKGRVSLDVQAVDEGLNEVCNNCIQHLISELTIPQPDRKCLKIVDVAEDDYNELLEEIKKEPDFNVEEKPLPSTNLKSFCTITDQYGAEIHVQFFTNQTLYIQGAISTLFVYMQTFMVDFLSPAPESVKDDFLKISSVEEDIFSDDLSHYFHHPEYLTGTVIETLINTSFVIANSATILPDYGAMTFGIFKALEALLYKRIRLTIATQNDFSCFKVDKTTGVASWRNATTPFDTTPPLKSALLRGYQFYIDNRHSTFHVDPTLVTTRILNKDDAIGLITDTIDKMNDICDNW